MIAALLNLRAAYCAWRAARTLKASKRWACRQAWADAERNRWLRRRR